MAQQATLSIDDLRDQPLIFYPPNAGVGLYDHLIRLCSQHGFAPRVVQEAQEPATIVGLAATGLGIAVVPSELQCIAAPNLVFRALSDEAAMTDLLLASRAGEGSKIIAHFRHIALASLSTSELD